MLLTRMLKVLLLAGLLALVAAMAVYAVAPSAFLAGAVATERWSAGLARHEKEVAGFRIVYLDGGGSGAPLVLVHGFGADKDTWVRVARVLRPKLRVIALDLPGFGESDSPLEGSYTIAEQVERLHGFVGALGLTHVHLGGHSMGGNIAATYAATYPNEVGSLWLIANSGIGSASPSELRKRIADTGKNALVPATQEEFREMLGWVMARPPYLPDRLAEVLAERAIANHELRTRQFAQLVREGSTLERRINGMPIPTHVLWGELDRAVNVDAVHVMMGILPNSDRTLMPGIGHIPMLEAPEETARDYLAFRKHYRL
jgi:pimeloyl-ACP methyl ester carboxylesterase